MKLHKNILVVSKDPLLLQARKLVLGTYFEVATAGRLSEAAAVLANQSFDLVVLCDTLSHYEREELGRLASTSASPPALLCLLGRDLKGADGLVGQPLLCTRGPLELLKACADTLGVTLTLGSHGRPAHQRGMLASM
jgi:hypothetical protein